MSDGRPGGRQASADDWRARARRLGTTRRRLFLGRAALGVAVPAAVWGSGLADRAWNVLGQRPGWIKTAAFVGGYCAATALSSLPLEYVSGYLVPKRYGLSTQGVSGWAVDWLKGLGLGVTLATAAGLALYGASWAFGASWWIAYWTGSMAAMALLTFVAPYVLVPIFFKPRPVEDTGIVTMIEDLVDKAGTQVAGVSQLDFSRRTNEANAAVIGFGRSRRVILADTLLDEFTPTEIRTVVAHELGHHVHRDVPTLLGVQAVVSLVGLFLASRYGDSVLRKLGAGDLRHVPAFPLVGLAGEVFALVLMPLVNALSRAIEARADRYALDLTGDPRAFASALRRLASQNLAEERPPRWAELLLASHPPIGTRIARAETAAGG
ncbi:MAG: M48 family metallopeptidase [Chloroflexi bacterium]|nr:M48 family metallopeptidase [Chloroflexota bacterium]